MYYSGIKPFSISDGEGVRASLFVSGCRNQCKGCFNPETWAFDYGKLFSEDTMHELIKMLTPHQIRGLSVLGGDPFEPENIDTVGLVCRTVKETFHGSKDVWLYTGRLYEEYASHPVMAYIDVLVDGPFIESQKDLSLMFRGSANQRIIDVKSSIAMREIVPWVPRIPAGQKE